MKGLALVLLLATPLAAGAQYAVPYRYPPPPPPRYTPPPPPPMVLPPPAPPLSPYYFNLGLGYGFGGTYQGDYWVPLSTYGSGGGLAYHVEAGARLMPQLLLGFDLSGLSTFGYGPYGGSAGVTLIDYDVVATLFPFVRGFFLRGGAGLSTLTTSVPVSGQYGVSTLGTNLLLGAGWAFPVALPLHFTLGLDWSHQFFGGADVTGSSIWMMRAGIGLY